MNAEQESIYTLDHPAVVASLEAMSFGRKSWEAARDECYAWLRVKESLDPGMGSNLGQRNICWARVNPARLGNKYCYYTIQLKAPGGTYITERMHAPNTLPKARSSPLLAKAVAKRDELRAEMVAKYGEPDKRTMGLGPEIRKVLNATTEGREYLVRAPSIVGHIMRRASTAEAYKPDEWSRGNSRTVHTVFYAQQDRLELLRRTWSTAEAEAERKRRNGVNRAAGVAVRGSRPRDPFHLDEPAQQISNSAVDADIDKWLELTKRLDQAGVLVEAWIEYEDQQKFNGRKLKAVA